MAGQRRSSPEFLKGRACALGLCVLGLCPAGLWGSGPVHAAVDSPRAWKAALAARQSFEAEPPAEHTRDEFTQVMDNFRAIYHANPADVHAPGAVDQVAALLEEQGRQLNDPKSLRAAAGQYEFLAKAYPASSLAGPGLARALVLLGPEASNDPAEAARVRSTLRVQYPRVAVAREPSGRVGAPTAEAHSTEVPGGLHRGAEVAGAAPALVPAGVSQNAAEGRDEGQASVSAHGDPAQVTSIRHWSTATYTRVAIDLGGEVQFRAARVVHPDRIFFDLHGARLVPALAGKSFTVTDEGFLKTIRAAQSGSDVTRIVLDVAPVAEYSAFLLPNPYRLIIDIHGRQPGGAKDDAAAETDREPTPEKLPAKGTPRADERASLTPPEAAPAPVIRSAAPMGGHAGEGGSTLPPMPVTDGSASFGLPPKRDQPINVSSTVARPRVVVPNKPTVARPVPNAVSTATPEGGREIAAVSEGPGVIEATSHPTSKPVVDRADPVPARKTSPGRTSPSAGIAAAVPAEAPPPTAEGQSTLLRALGLKIGRIVIDAGHGGHDSGTLGPEGIEEKDVVLDVALRLGKLLHDRLGAEVVYTRADDTFVPLETRTAIANKAQADLFISVHANSSPDAAARGVEVYYLNFTSDPEAMQVASRENAVSSGRVNQLSSLVKKIALKDKIDESRELAADVDDSLYSGLRKGNGGLKNRGVKKAPFVVLIGANMPSILAEISFVTNPEDAAELNRPDYRERVAESLYGGIARYAGTINGAKGKAKGTERAQR